MSLVRPSRTCRFAAAISICVALALGACTSTPEPTAIPASSSPAAASTQAPSPGPESSGPAAELVIPITITHDSVDPSGKKVDVAKGTTVVLEVTSEIDDEIHAHTGGDGYELEVAAEKTTRGEFVVEEAGNFEVESHHLEKIIVILNVR